ncbi:zonular occludens toxin domain-containing protein [Amphibacillus cookii]|uniref:zonular occludens toxin domain-containing protein n=1 Tax=Amphibacillus cookii TaxID=767787 RepID=UPI00195C53F9|nr:zonular occludens toxin domain-containing protein [Amphibacillus cookii]MBM7543262.1 GTPase SAR1 family protein [Amphibacillus cookii]
MAHHMFIQGGLGSGKTFLMSLLAHHWKQRTAMRGGHVELFSNYELLDSQPMSHYTDWYKVAEAQGSIICWDESQMAFSNRKWSRYGSGVATEVLMFTRKMKSIQLYCSPNINNVDSRIRDIIEVLVTTRKIGDKGFQLHFMDYQTKQFMHTQFIPMYKAKQIFKLNLYDTYNMVTSFPLPSDERQGNEFFETLNDIHNKARGKIKHGNKRIIHSAEGV